MHYSVTAEQWPLARPFVTAREVMHHLPLVLLTISDEGVTGQAEAAGVDYHGETVSTIMAQIEACLAGRSKLPSRHDLIALLPPGGARNAIDCALWDLEAKQTGRSAAQIAGMADLVPLQTVYTLSLDQPERMADAVGLSPPGAILKLKIGGRDGLDIARVQAVRRASPSSRLIVDVNEGWTRTELDQYGLALWPLGVEMIEQPLQEGQDHWLAGYGGPIPLCADESANTAEDLVRLDDYAFINIKLDKTGGLTAALELAVKARARGKQLMVGSMLGTSLGMAPAFLVGQLCTYVDLDGPLLLAKDRRPAMSFAGKTVLPPPADLWG